jgi:hypothetical protein
LRPCNLSDHFLEEILQKYKDAVHPITGETLIRIVGEPRAEDAYIYFRFGEGAIIPYRCEYFLRFSSKLVRRDPKVGDYLREVYFVAKRYFPNNLEYWLEGGQSFTYHASESAPHDPMDVYEARKKLKEHEGVYQTFPVSKKLSGTSEQTHPTYLSHRAHLRQPALLESRASYALVTSQIPQCRRTSSICR